MTGRSRESRGMLNRVAGRVGRLMLLLVLMWLTLLGPGSAAQRPRLLTFVDCVMWQETPPGTATQEDEKPKSLYLVGTVTLRNETSKTLTLRTAVLHVMDGYNNALFDLPIDTYTLGARQTVRIPIVRYYAGGVGIFRFRGEFTLVGQEDPEPLILEPINQAPLTPGH